MSRKEDNDIIMMLLEEDLASLATTLVVASWCNYSTTTSAVDVTNCTAKTTCNKTSQYMK